jgi:hypothetical protein
MERYLREEEERTREDNRRLAEFARRKQALDAAKQQKHRFRLAVLVVGCITC